MSADEQLNGAGRPLGTVLVTGGASGLGAAVAAAVRDAGGTPVVLDLRPPDGGFPFYEVDLSRPRDAEEAVRTAAEEHGGLDGVVTAAGTDACGDILDVDPEAWDRVVMVNLLGTAAVVRAALPALERSRGRVVTVASTLGLRALPAATAYCASKFGVVGFTEALAAELQDTDIGVWAVCPGQVDTPLAWKTGVAPDERKSLIRPESVARVIAQLVMGRRRERSGAAIDVTR